MRRSRSNNADTNRYPTTSRTSRSTAKKITSVGVIWMTLYAMNAVTTADGMLATTPSCCATRISLTSRGDRHAQPDRPSGDERCEQHLSDQVRRLEGCRCDRGVCKQRETREEEAEHCIRDAECRKERRERLPDQELLAANRGREHRLERALLALPNHRVRGDRRRHQCRNAKQVRERVAVEEATCLRRRQLEQ